MKIDFSAQPQNLMSSVDVEDSSTHSMAQHNETQAMKSPKFRTLAHLEQNDV